MRANKVGEKKSRPKERFFERLSLSLLALSVVAHKALRNNDDKYLKDDEIKYQSSPEEFRGGSLFLRRLQRNLVAGKFVEVVRD